MRNLWRTTTSILVWLGTMLTVQPGTSGELGIPGQSVLQKEARHQELAIEDVIRQAAFVHGIDAELMLAIAHVESSMNPRAVGTNDDTGLFQLRKKFFGDEASFDPVVNANAAARYLAWLKKRPACRAYGKAWFICYNRGPNSLAVDEPKQNKYYKRVIVAMRERVSSVVVNTASADQ